MAGSADDIKAKARMTCGGFSGLGRCSEDDGGTSDEKNLGVL